MMNKINREKIETTDNLAQAIKELFNLDLEGRLCIFDHEAMEGEVARAYDKLGLESRRETYRRIAEDFKHRTKYRENGSGKPKRILDVGCGSGLLTLELAEQTNGTIQGLDISKDMFELARKNKDERIGRISQKVLQNGPLLKVVYRTYFDYGSVYDLSVMAKGEEIVDFIICRNALHRFRNPKKALEEMYTVLKRGGKIYIRDLKRDANWKTVVERIGDERWKIPALVRDYVGAMASTLTTNELEDILQSFGVKNFKISHGGYMNSSAIERDKNIREYEKETEYVCVIEKPKE